MSDQRKFTDLSPTSQGVIIVVGVAQIALAVAAAVDLARRPAAEVRGPKAAWAAALLVDFVGPIGYFVFGRRR